MRNTHSLVAGGQQRRHILTQTHEGRPFLWLAVPALHHHLIPEKNTTLLEKTAQLSLVIFQ